MQAARLLARLQREITMLKTDPPPGVCAWPHNDLLTHLEAQIQGPANTVYSRGLFKLDVQVPERYPFEPPCVRFVTPIYHPNIDSGGRICLDILNMPPKGAWKPSLNIPTVLTSIGLLLSDPNPDDGLMGDITAEYKHHRSSFDQKARKMTEQYALPSMQFDTGRQGKTSTSSVVQVSSPMPSANRKSDIKLPADMHPAQDNEAVSSSCKSNGDEVATATAHRQRLALGKKLSLTKPEPLPAAVHAKQQLCGPSRVQEEDEQLSAADLNLKVMEQRPEDGVELDSEKTSAGCTTTKQVQNMHPSLPRPGLLGKAVSEEPPRPSRLSLLSRLKTSRPRLQKPTLSSGQSSTSTNQEAACTVVSDSESDSEEVPPLRSRLSLTQRAYAGKRKASLLR